MGISTDNFLISAWRHEWLSAGRTEATHDLYVMQLRIFERWLSEQGKTLDDAVKRDCTMYLLHRRQDRSAATADFSFKALRSYYNFLGTLDEDASNPMAGVKSPRVPEPATKGVDPADLRKLLGSLTGKDFRSVRDRAIVQLLACTGLRIGELARLNVDDVNLNQRVLMIKRTKTGKPRVVPMSGEAATTVIRYLRLRAKQATLPGDWSWVKGEDDGPMWGSEKGPMNALGMATMFERRCKPLGVHITAHMFRRSFAVTFLTAGGSQTSLQSICGWSSGAMVTRYTRHSASELAQAEYRRLFS